MKCKIRNILLAVMVSLCLSGMAAGALAASFESIQFGDRSEQVTRVQEELIRQGYLDGDADGIFGQMTQSAVRAFQQAKGLTVTGIVDETTYNQLMGIDSGDETGGDGVIVDENPGESTTGQTQNGQNSQASAGAQSGRSSSETTGPQSRQSGSSGTSTAQSGQSSSAAAGTQGSQSSSAAAGTQGSQSSSAAAGTQSAVSAEGGTEQITEQSTEDHGEAIIRSNTVEDSEEDSLEDVEESTETEKSRTITMDGALPDLRVLDSNQDLEIADAGYTISDGYLYYSFILHNNSREMAYEYPSVTFSALDSRGNTIRTGEQIVGIVYPSQDYAWGYLRFDITSQPSVIEMEVTTGRYSEVSTDTLEHPEYEPLEVADVSREGNTFRGEIINNNSYALEFGAAIVIVFRDEDGALIGGDVTFTDAMEGHAGSCAFEWNPTFPAATEDYEIYAYPW